MKVYITNLDKEIDKNKLINNISYILIYKKYEI